MSLGVPDDDDDGRPKAPTSAPAKIRCGRPKKVNGRGKRGKPASKLRHARSGDRKASAQSPKPYSAKRPAAMIARTLCSRTSLPGKKKLNEKELRIAINALLVSNHPNALKKDWAKISVTIASTLKIETRLVKRVMEMIASGQDLETRKPGGGKKPRIKPGTPKADRLVGALRDGFGGRHAAAKINELGVSPGKKPILSQVVLRAAKHTFGMVCAKRAIIKTGSRNDGSPWSISRLAICQQFKKDIEEGKKSLEGTLFVDEHSEFCVLGKRAHHGQSMHHEWRAPLNEDGKWCPVDKGGRIEPTNPITRPKNAKRADGVFGVCAPTPHGEQREGRKMTPFRYKGKVIGKTAYTNALQAVIASARELGRKSRLKLQKDPKARKSCWHAHAEFDGPGGPYESRWGDNWKDHLPKSFSDVCITLIMDHVISEGNRLFADTPFAKNWTIYHDALPQWWERAAQDHIRMRGFWHRQWMADEITNGKVHGRYKNRLMGDSPELMPLDSSLFNDLIEGIAINVVATGSMKRGRRYSMGLPDEAWRTITSVWETTPSSRRITQDIERFRTALDRIIEANGAYVEEYDCRHGHRKATQKAVLGGALKMNAEGNLTDQALEGMKELETSWEGLTQSQTSSF